ncbi:MAG: FtsX-like permease family protein [Clostridia bacterium]|nr:FtsX-like permease family protein [Clostridia bacterium]
MMYSNNQIMDVDEEENKSFGKSLIFVLSLENIKKSFKDYAIYFLTIVLGVAIFYMFNSLDTQEAMLKVSESTRQIVKLMVEMLGYISVFVSIILGLLIVYANSFLINRRKKEFGIYMLLGMGKGQISKIIILETIFIGIISLFVGLLIRSICFTVYVYISFKIISSKYGKL